MSYPSVYCVRCKTHTETLGRHTVILSNNRRALKGVCPVCASETYRMMPQKKLEDAAEPKRPAAPKQPTHLSVISSKVLLRPEFFSEVPVHKKRLDPVSEAIYLSSTFPQRLVTYGLLTVVFGLSAAIGFSMCLLLFTR